MERSTLGISCSFETVMADRARKPLKGGSHWILSPVRNISTKRPETPRNVY